VTVETGATFGWERRAGAEGATLGIDRFGASAPGEENMQRFGSTAGRVAAAALRLLFHSLGLAVEEAEGGATGTRSGVARGVIDGSGHPSSGVGVRNGRPSGRSLGFAPPLIPPCPR